MLSILILGFLLLSKQGELKTDYTIDEPDQFEEFEDYIEELEDYIKEFEDHDQKNPSGCKQTQSFKSRDIKSELSRVLMSKDSTSPSDEYNRIQGFIPTPGTSQGQLDCSSEVAEVRECAFEYHHSLGLDNECSLSDQKEKEKWITRVALRSFEYRIPIKLFENYDSKEKYLLCITFLSSNEKKKLPVETHQFHKEYVVVYIQSAYFTEYMLNTNVSLCFEVESNSNYVKRSSFFNFKRVNKAISTNERFPFATKENVKYFSANTFEQQDRKPFPEVPKCLFYDSIGEYIIRHKNRGMFVLNLSSQSELIFYVQNIPFLFDPIYKKYFEANKAACLEEMKFLSETRKKLFISFYDSFLNKIGKLSPENVVEISLCLYDILLDIAKNFDEYKEAPNFFKHFSFIKNEIKAFADDKQSQEKLKCRLEQYSSILDRTSEYHSSHYKCLNAIFTSLFSCNKEEDKEYSLKLNI